MFDRLINRLVEEILKIVFGILRAIADILAPPPDDPLLKIFWDISSSIRWRRYVAALNSVSDGRCLQFTLVFDFLAKEKDIIKIERITHKLAESEIKDGLKIKEELKDLPCDCQNINKMLETICHYSTLDADTENLKNVSGTRLKEIRKNSLELLDNLSST